MDFFDYNKEAQLHALWNAVTIVRGIPYTLFTFGDSDLDYYLVLTPMTPGDPVKVRQGEIKITRPRIITPYSARPELQDFFESEDSENLISFLMARTAGFSNLKLCNTAGPEKLISDQPQEVIDQLQRKLDNEEEDRVAILSAPEPLAGIALIRFAAEQIMASAQDNLNELRERGFLP